MKLYDLVFEEAQYDQRVPQDAADILEDIKTRQRNCVQESQFQRENRLEREYNALQQGKMSSAEFHAQYEKLANEMRRAGMGIASDPEALRRNYLRKINSELSTKILSFTWELDGPDKPTRKPKTWQEVYTAIIQELRVQADARGVDSRREEVRYTGGVPDPPAPAHGRVCKHCGRDGHQPNICPLVVAKQKGEDEKCR